MPKILPGSGKRNTALQLRHLTAYQLKQIYQQSYDWTTFKKKNATVKCNLLSFLHPPQNDP